MCKLAAFFDLVGFAPHCQFLLNVGSDRGWEQACDGFTESEVTVLQLFWSFSDFRQLDFLGLVEGGGRRGSPEVSFPLIFALLDTSVRHRCGYSAKPQQAQQAGSTRLRFFFVRPVSVESPVVDMPMHGEHAGAARVRGERRMRSFWRHEQMAIQMVLASVQHHSQGAPRGQTTATKTRGEGESHEMKYTAKFRRTPPAE